MKSLHFTVLILFTATCAFSQRPDSAKTTKPIVLLNGIPVTDSISLNKFDRIDFIQGKRAIDLLGPKAASGIYIIRGDGKIPVYGEVVDRKRKKIKNAEVINSHGTVLTLTNHCGSFFLPSLSIGEEVVIRKKRFVEKRFVIQQTHHVITLNKN
jgi:hypothetical protein